jgi:hypothetical protein
VQRIAPGCTGLQRPALLRVAALSSGPEEIDDRVTLPAG